MSGRPLPQPLGGWTLPTLTLMALVLTAQAAHAQERDADAEPRRVYVPLAELDVITDRDQKGVILPQDEFDELYQAARNAQGQLPEHPVIVTGADYRAEIAGDQLLIEASIRFTQFTDDWHVWPHPFQRLTIERATIDGEPALLGRDPKGRVRLMTRGAGDFTLQLESSTELAADGSDQIAAFNLVGAPAGRLTLTLPPGKRLMADDVLLARPAPIEAAADYEVFVGFEPSITLRITDRSRVEAADFLLFATTGYGLNVAPGEITWHALTTLQVYGNPVDRLTLSVPNVLEIAEVDSTGLEGWELADDPDDDARTQIRLSYARPFDGLRRVVLKGVMATTTGEPWSVPPLTIASATSHVGQVVLRHPPAVRLRAREAVGVRRTALDAEPVTSALPSAAAPSAELVTLRYDVWREDFLLRFLTQPKDRELYAGVASVLDVNASGLDLASSLTLETRFAPLFELDLTIPAEWTITSATIAGDPVRWQILPQQAGVHQVRLLFDPPLAADATTVVGLAAHRDLEDWPVENDPAAFGLPELYLPQATLSEGTFVVRGDDDLEIEAVELTGLETAPLKADWERLRFQSQDTRYGGVLRVTRRPARLAARTMHFVRLDPRSLQTHLEVLLNVEGGGLRGVRIALAAEAGENLRFSVSGQDVRIVEQKPGDPAGDQRVWTIEFDRRVRGRLLLTTQFQIPRGDGEEFSVAAVNVLDADRQNGHIALEASPQQRLEISAVDDAGNELPEVDPIDVPPTGYTPRERLVAVYRYVAPGYAVSLSEERYDRLAVPTAICHRLDLTSILGENGELQQAARFQLTAIGVQSLQLELPAEARLWATLVDGAPVEVRRTDDVYLIPLPTAASVEERRSLELYYQTHVAPLLRFGTIAQPPPQLSVISGQGNEQALAVLEQTWTFHHPREALVVDSTGPFETDQELDSSSVLWRLRRSFRVPPPTTVWWNLFAVAVTLGVIALFLKGYRRWGGPGLFVSAAVVGGILLIVLFVLLLPATQTAREAARRSSAQNMVRDEIELSQHSYYDDVAAPSGAEGGGTAAATPATTAEPPPMAPAADEQSFFEDAEPAAAPADKPMPEPRVAPSAPDDETEDRPQQQLPAAGGLLAQQQAGDLDDVQQFDVAPQEAPAARGRPKGLLSLAVEMQPPQGTIAKRFRYAGAETAATGVALQVRYENREAGMAHRLLLILAVAAIFWIQRNQSVRQRGLLATLGVTLPLALMTVVPSGSWHILLDGVFFGSLGGLLLWIVRSIVRGCQRAARRLAGLTASLALVLAIGAGADVDAQEQSKPAASSRETVVIPYEEGQDPLAADRVYLPHEQFVKLWNRAHPDQRLQSPPPRTAEVVEALYDAELTGDGEQRRVSIAGRLAVYNFVDRQVTVPLPLGPVALSSAQLDGASAPLRPRKNGYELVVGQRGLHVLDVEFEVAASLAGPAGQFTLPVTPVPAGRLTFTLPAEDLSVRVNGSSTAYRRRTGGEDQLVEVSIDKAKSVTIAWQPETMRGAVAAVVHAESGTAVAVDDGGIRLSSGIQYRIRQGALSDVSFSLPAELRLQGVRGADVGGWELAGDADQRKLRVFFRRSVNDATELTLDAYRDAAVTTETQALAIPQIVPLEVTHETGSIAIFAAEQFSVRGGSLENLTQINVTGFESPAPITRPQSPPVLAYRFSRRPVGLETLVARRVPEADVSAVHGVFIGRRKQLLTSRFEYVLSGVPRSTLSFRLPEDFLLLNVNATGLRDWYRNAAAAGGALVVELAEPQTGRVEVVLEGTLPKEPDDAEAALPLPHPLDATRLSSRLAVWLDDVYTARLDALAGWRSLDPAELTGAQRGLHPDRVRFAFESSVDEPQPIELALERATPRLSAEGIAVIAMTEAALAYSFGLQWTIEQAATDTLLITLPNRFDGRLDFQGDGIRQVTTEDAGAGRTRWTISLRAPVQGRYFVSGTATLPPASEQVAAPALIFESSDGAPSPLPTQRQYVLLVNQSQSQLTAESPELVEAVQPDEVPINVRQSLIDQAAELVRVKTIGTAPTWRTQKFAQVQGAPATVNVADLTSVIARDGTWRSEAVYTIKNRSRQFLALRMPEGAVLMSVFVNDRPARAVETTLAGATIRLIALPKTSAADLSFPVRIVFAGLLPGGALPQDVRVLATELDLPAPQVVSQQESDEFGIPVARTRWTVFLPDDLDATPLEDPSRNNFALEPSDQPDLTYEWATLQDLRDMIAVQSQREYLGSSNYYRARDNTKQLQQAIAEAQQRIAAGSRSREAARFAAESEKTLEQLQEVEEELAQSGDRADVVSAGESAGESAQAAQALQNSAALWRDNRIDVDAEAIAQNESFRFQLQAPEPRSGRKPKSEAAAKLPALKADVQSETRAQLREQSESQLEMLNSAIVNLKGGQQAQQEARQGQAVQQRAAGEPAASRMFGAQRGAADQPPGAGFRGGGFGGGLAGEEGRAAAGPTAWTQTGGLSLDLELPEAGQRLTFTKIGGDPRLALDVRPHESLQFGFGLIWTLVWMTVGFALVAAFLRAGAGGGAARQIPLGAALVGVIGFFLMPQPLSWLSFLLFVGGAVGVAFVNRDPRRQAA